MKALLSPAAILTLLALSGCSTAPEQEVKPEAVTATLDQPATIKPQTFMIRGKVVVGHEARTITPCGSNLQYWLALTPEDSMIAMALPSSPYQEMYGEMIGHLETPSQVGFDSDYKARFVVDQVNMLTTENPNRCEQPLKPTRAFGTEPFWSASFEKNNVVFEMMGEDKQTFEIKRSQLSANKREYQLDQGSMTLTKQPCSDSMSDSIYGWQSSLDVAGKNHIGCATVSNQDSTQEWAGLYHASSTQSTDFSVRMQLNSDHSASTHYNYNNDQPSTIERGYWQQLNPNQIQVVMTRHQQQFLVSERIFTREGYTLKADKEKVSDHVYPIANGGLVLFRANATTTESTKATLSTQTNINLSAQNIPSSDQFNTKVDSALRHYFKMHKTDPTNTKYRWLTYDLNGDGKEELLTQLDWCGSGGCTLLVFENHNDDWRFNSRITLVNTPIRIGVNASNGWQDLIFQVSGGGATSNQHIMQYSYVSYPMNPSVAPVAKPNEISEVVLFSDGLSPKQQGLAL